MPGLLLNRGVCSTPNWSDNKCLPVQQNTNHASPPDSKYEKQFQIISDVCPSISDAHHPFDDSSKCQPSNPLFISTPSFPTDKFSDPHIKSEFTARRFSQMYSEDTCKHLQALEVEPPLIEYLTLHGAISEADGKMILEADRQQQRYMLFHVLGLFDQINHPRDNSISSINMGFSLLLNALRSTGHHSLASYLDYSRRIIPRESSGYSNKSCADEALLAHRKRGQFSVCIRLNAVKVPPYIYEQLNSLRVNSKTPDSVPTSHCLSGSVSPQTLPSQQQIADQATRSYQAVLPSCAAELQHSGTPSSVCPKSVDRSLVTNYWIDIASLEKNKPSQSVCESTGLTDQKPHTTSAKSSANSTGCFAKLCQVFNYRKRKPVQTSLHPAAVQPFRSKPESSDDGIRLARMAFLQEKAQEFCQFTSDSSLPYQDAVVKYFEQATGVLVLDFQTESQPNRGQHPSGRTCVSAAEAPTTLPLLRVIVVATKTAVIRRLVEVCRQPPADSSTPDSRLASDLRVSLETSGLLDCLQLDDLRLAVSIDPVEVKQATGELEEMMVE